MTTLRWGWSVAKRPDKWIGAFRTREEAIADAHEHSRKTFYVVSGHIPESTRFMPDADAIEDMLGQAASDAGGDAAVDFPSVSKEGLAELNELLTTWAKKNLGECTFWISEGEPEKIVPEEPMTEVQEPT